MDGGVLGLRGQSSREVSGCLRVLLHVVACEPAVVEIPRARVELDGACEALLGFLEGLLLDVGESQVVVGFGTGRLQVDRLLQVLDGVLQLPNFPVADSTVKVRLEWRSYFLVDGLREAIDRPVILLQIYVDQPTLEVVLRCLALLILATLLLCTNLLEAQSVVVVSQGILDPAQPPEAKAALAIVLRGGGVQPDAHGEIR
mmetsp:Transcript_19349/g.41153  ORF Transcript_19349/g.41153 Transcript_19349/m.41153 type:complete len:201 (-) Transcript_19349:422-1024(-)